MRKALILALFIAYAFLLNPGEALACTLKLTPSTFNAATGETLTFHLERYPTHRQCVLPLEDTKILITGGKLIDPGVWKQGTPDVLDFKVAFDQPGQAIVRVERNCPKSGLIAVEARGMIANASNTTAPSATSTTGQVSLPARPSETAVPPTTVTGTSATGEGVHPPEAYVLSTQDQGDSSNPWWFASSINLRLWYIFLTAGLLAYLLKLTRHRKPLLFLSVIILGFYLGGCPEPVGAPFYLLSRNQALFGTALILLALPLALSLIWGRVFCGWVCPLGATQELIHAGQVLGKGSYRVPTFMDKALKQLKFVVLAVFGYLSWQTSYNAFSNYDPFKVLFNFVGTPLTVTLLIITLLLSIFLSRPFCRYICPLGALFTITARIAPFAVRVNQEACNGCGLCQKEGGCPMSAISDCGGTAHQPCFDRGECIMCRNCETTCRRFALKVRGRSS